MLVLTKYHFPTLLVRGNVFPMTTFFGNVVETMFISSKMELSDICRCEHKNIEFLLPKMGNAWVEQAFTRHILMTGIDMHDPLFWVFNMTAHRVYPFGSCNHIIKSEIERMLSNKNERNDFFHDNEFG